MLADRLQFAFTVMFHYLFPIGTIGLAPFVAAYTWKAARTGDPDAGRAARFWTKIFAVNFAAGVVTGIPMEFQFGTNWAAFSRRTGSVVGQPLAMEGVFAFFLESVFLGDTAVPAARAADPAHRRGRRCSSASDRGSPAFSSSPPMRGCSIRSATRSPPTARSAREHRALLLSPWAWWQFAHVITGALLAGAMVVAGFGAYYLLAKREPAIGRRFVRAGMIAAFIFER